jgi:demethylmenaquinone methyltransferase / 2-methoxy-6-polyprenyl-1,4-benzoquinol methylase
VDKTIISSGGATPPGITDEKQAATWVREMFSGVAARYDLLNHLLSFNIDRGWRQRLLSRVKPILDRKEAAILDLCCGTGDVLLELQRTAAAPVYGADFCHPMLVAARQKIASRGLRSPLFEGDALQLPLRDCSLDLITIAFGFRNLANYRAGLAELYRVLRPGGMLAILEFSHPRGLLMRSSYGLYSRLLMPVIGGTISGSRAAYTYLPQSIEKFPRAEALQSMMEQQGFRDTAFELLTGGIAALHLGIRPE